MDEEVEQQQDSSPRGFAAIELTPEERTALEEDAAKGARAAEEEARVAARRERLQALLKVEVPIIVRLAEKPIPLQAVIKLSEGHILQFDKTADSPLDLMVANRVIGKGEAVRIGENFGIQIKEIGHPRETIKKLGSSGGLVSP